ncbi:DUF3289 family protein [Sinomicrobium soli]|uniref:DUF3289 family protein n=1 Tax=Sinomicrobium sp. N-1-3-6 TaxID=2219864 RepID=UPI000DCCB760|nr:DUF3289 family protein [Sinomicrobium sp. N-1-3-6]RAV27887.1 hypothetical protein DN748_16640 [Sinomicrobium sp. N-1-3-6]
MAGEEKRNKKTPPESKKFVMNGARIKCDLCSKPEGKLRVTSNDLKLQDMLWANINDTNGAQNLIFDGVCNHGKYGDKKPLCKSVIQLKGWDKPASVTIQDAPGIVMESQNYCLPHGNQKIEITDSGQTATESEIEEKDEHRVTKVEGGSLVLFNSSGEYQVTEYNVAEKQVDKSTVKWAFRVDGKIWYLKSTGDHLRLKFNVEEHIGKKIEILSYIEDLNESVSVSTEIIGLPIFIDKYNFKGKQFKNGLFIIADDMCYGDGVNLSTGHTIYSQERIESYGWMMKGTMKMSEDRLWDTFSTMVLDIFAWGELNDVALKMIAHFKANTGTEFSDPVLTRHAKEHPSTKRFCKEIERMIVERLKKEDGALALIQHKFYNGNNGDTPRTYDMNYGHPRFKYNEDGWSGKKGLTILVNDTWAYEVSITGFEEKKKDFKITYKVTLYDHFGLDEPDLEKNYYYMEGFRAWFVLQHLRGYKPFITKMEFENTFNGAYQT